MSELNKFGVLTFILLVVQFGLMGVVAAEDDFSAHSSYEQLTLKCEDNGELVSTKTFADGVNVTYVNATGAKQVYTQRGSANYGKNDDGTNNTDEVIIQVTREGTDTPVFSWKVSCPEGVMVIESHP